LLARIGRVDAQLNAFVTLTRDVAMSDALRAEQELASGMDRGPLHGIPYGAKDLVATRGIRTTWGARPFAERVFDFDAAVITRLREAGAVLVGKCAMVEMAGGMGYETASASLTGAARNPWNTERWTCGSSSGSGAAVSARLLPMAIGSETWGSITCPAAFSGISGLRPTYGRVSRRGAMALSWTLDKLGPMARSAEDCELMLEVMAGHDPEDPTSLAEEMGAPLTLSEALRLRVGIVRTPIPEGGDPACDRVFDAAVEALRRAGLSPREVTLPDLPVESAAWVLIVGEGSSAFASVFEGGFDREMADPDAPLAQAMSRLVHAADYLKAMRVRNLAQRAYADLFSEVDAIVALTYPFTAPPAEGSFAKYFNAPDPVGAAGNLCGLPGMAVPAGFGSDGLPLGIVFMAGACEDRKALALGRLYQSVTDWHSMKPPIAL
jgi:aspartyl-tRNA(Asn)/glutamyl-tRNA(Gln) amidotransferase subunit A